MISKGICQTSKVGKINGLPRDKSNFKSILLFHVFFSASKALSIYLYRTADLVLFQSAII